MGCRNIRKEARRIRQRIERETNIIKKRHMVLEYETLLETIEA